MKKSVPLDPYFVARMAPLQELTVVDLTDPEKARVLMDYYSDLDGWSLPEGVLVEDATIQGLAGVVPVRVYRPASTARAALLWLHGGGFSQGSLDMAESHVVCAELASRADALVVAVDYRVAVDGVHFPAPVDDAVTAWSWLLKQWDGAGVSAIGGASAGAAIAMSAALRLTGSRRPDQLLLAYPFVHFPVPALDFATAGDLDALPPLMRFNAEAVLSMVKTYVGRITNIPVDALPGAADLSGLPPTRIVIAELDDLRSSGDLLERQLREAGVAVISHLAQGMPHGHLNRGTALHEVPRTLDFFATALRANV
ncbi:alpha/beta hydrolase fold domain-containing protein [Actinoplanes missouriensis]|uniref:alpha/beta hydrolase n=1 Tax=Actinoplanes missouriensis TaxID=1866 RepID=UPI0033DD5308